MKRTLWLSVLAALGLVACGQGARTKAATATKPVDENTLLWKISGNNLSKPSYLFGTMHMICASDIVVSDSLKSAIRRADKVYLELDMDDMLGMMFGAMSKLTMRGDTTLSDLLTPEEYTKVKSFFEANSGGMIPFNMMERFKPMFISSMVMEQAQACENMIVMESLVMEEAKKHKKEVDGLETIEYQLGIFDQIPYKLQAKQLVEMVDSDNKSAEDSVMAMLTNAYRRQELTKMEDLTKSDKSISDYSDILLYNRNAAWATKLQELMAKQSLVIAVGAGHLPGSKGVINLLRKAGYKVEPVRNDMIVKKKAEEI